MTLRNGHGTGAGMPRVELLPPDEQPRGIPAPAGPAEPPEPARVRRPNGQIADSQTASELGRRGGLARAAKAAQLRALTGLGLLGAQPDLLKPYLDAALEFAEHEVARLARDCGGGVCPSNAAALVLAAARAMAGSCAAYATGELALGARLGAEIRSNLLGARELCVRDAQVRPRGKGSLSVLLDEGDEEPAPRQAPASSGPVEAEGATDDANASGGHG
jgi:hypothetical protein